MKNIDKIKTTYNLYSTERKYRRNTLVSFYFQKNRKIIKKSRPIDIDGERFKLNLLTGEIKNYKRKEIDISHNASIRRTKICMNMLFEMNDFDWFLTITFDRQKIDRTNDKAVMQCYKRYVDNLYHKYPNFKYICVPERHEDGCIHFHMLVGGLSASQMGLVNSGKVCCHWVDKKFNGICSKEYFEKTKSLHTLKETDGEPIYNATSFAYGYTTVSRIVSRERCKTYVKKYIDKDIGSTEIFKKRFYYSHNLNVPFVVKRLVEADFDTPKKIDSLESIKESPYVQNANSNPYMSDYNVIQIWIDNQTKSMIDKGFFPIKDDIDINDIF